MTPSARLEQDTERTRAQIEETLEEIRRRMTPGRMVDQFLDYTRDSAGGQFLGNLRQQVADNPVPVALIGAGLAWIMMSNRGARGNGNWAPDASEQIGAPIPTNEGFEDSVKDAANSIGEKGSDLGQRAGNIGSRVGAAASEAASAVGKATSSAYGRTTDSASHAASVMRDNASAASRSVREFANDQPLIVAGIGLAIGAVIGALLPRTEAEDRLMGTTSDDLKGEAQEFAKEQYEKGKAVAERAYEAGRNEADRMSGSDEQNQTSIAPSGTETMNDSGDDAVRSSEHLHGSST